MSRTRDTRGSSRRDAGSETHRVQPSERKWIWFRTQPGGRLVAREEFEALDVYGRAGLAKTMQRYRDGQARRHDVDSMGDGIFELRYRHGTERFRLLFMFWGPHLVALTVFQKKQAKTSKIDLDRARGRAKHWRRAFGTEPAETTS